MTVINIKDFDQYRFSLLVAKIKNVKADYDADLNQDEHLKGYRYNDNDRIARTVLGYFYGEAKFDGVQANAKFISLNSEETLPYIKKAVLESASADYHYTYEKQW